MGGQPRLHGRTTVKRADKLPAKEDPYTRLRRKLDEDNNQKKQQQKRGRKVRSAGMRKT
jgi:hypothetical protein